MTTQAPADLPISSLGGDRCTLDEWLTTFQLVLVVLDPYTNQSSWILDTAGRILGDFRGADCRVGFLVTAPADDARQFLGPWADELFTLIDPDYAAVKALGVTHTPALVHLRQDSLVLGVAEGWHPEQWRAVTDHLATMMGWTTKPVAAGPTPFDGVAVPA